MADVTASMGIDMSDVAKELAKLPAMTSAEAEKAVRQLTKSFDRAATEVKKLQAETARSSAAAGQDLKKIGQAAGDAESSMRALSGAIGMVSPEAAAAVNAIAELGGAVEGLGRGQGVLSQLGVSMSSLGPIALAAAAAAASLGMAYLVLADNAERADERVSRIARTTAALGASHAELGKVVDEVDLTFRRTIGTYDQVAEAQAARDAAIKQAAEAERRAAQGLVQTAQANIAAASGTEERVAAVNALAQAELQRDRLLEGANAREAQALDQSALTTEYLREQAEEERRLRAATDARAAGAEAAAARTRMEAEAAREAAEALRVQAAAEAELAAQVQGSNEAAALITGLTEHRLSEMGRIDLAEQEAMARLLETEQATQEQILALQEEFQARRLDLADKEAKARRERSNEAIESARREQEAITAAAMARATSMTMVLGTLADSVVASLRAQGNASKEAMAAAFTAQKIMAISDIAVKTAQGVMAVWATWAAVPPVAGLLAGAVIATGAVQAGLVANQNPSFHVGGMVGRSGPPAPDEVDARLLRGESVLNRRATEQLGQRGVEDLNAGRTTTTQVVVVQKYKHKVLDEVVYDNVRMPDSSLRKAIQGRRRVGHRSR